MPAPEPTPHIHFDLLRDATSNLFDVSCQPAVRHFQRSCQTSSTPWRHPPRRPETAMRPHWWSRRRRWTRCGKFGEAFWESIQLRHHHSSFIIHHSSFIIHHIHHPLSINILDCLAHPSTSYLPPPFFRFFGFGLPKPRRRNCGSSPWLPSCCRPLPRSNRNPRRGCLRCTEKNENSGYQAESKWIYL